MFASNRILEVQSCEYTLTKNSSKFQYSYYYAQIGHKKCQHQRKLN